MENTHCTLPKLLPCACIMMIQANSIYNYTFWFLHHLSSQTNALANDYDADFLRSFEIGFALMVCDIVSQLTLVA